MDRLEMFLLGLLEKEKFEYLEPYMEAGEGAPANTLIGNPVGDILDFIENQGMLPPEASIEKVTHRNGAGDTLTQFMDVNEWEPEENDNE